MTLLEIATLAGETVQMTDADALELAKGFAAFKYAKTFRENLWRDSVSIFPFLLDPTGDSTTPTGGNAALTALAAQGFYLLPDVVERVLAVRTAALDVIDWSGSAGQNPAARQWEGVDPARLFRDDLDAFAESGEPVRFMACGAVATMLPGTGTATVWAAAAADAGVTIRLAALNAVTNARETAAAALTTTAAAIGPTKCREIYAIAKPATNGVVYIGDADGVAVATLNADDTGAPLRVPLRLLPYPTGVTAFRAMVKRRPLTLTDNDTPDLRGIDDVLLEYTTGKLREMAGQVQTAQLNFQRADAALAAMLGTEILQTADSARLIPGEGYGE